MSAHIASDSPRASLVGSGRDQLSTPAPATTIGICAVCGASLAGRRAHAKTCSARCRQQASRRARGLGRAARPVPAPSRAAQLAARWDLEARDFWRTPPELVEGVASLLNGAFGLDAAAAGDDALAPRFLTPDQDALTCDWAAACDPASPRVWCNPPYSRKGGRGRGLLAWVEAAVRARDAGLTVALLVPPAVSTRYWRLAMQEAATIKLLSRRVSFLHPDTGKPSAGNRGDSAVVILAPGRRGAAAVESWSGTGSLLQTYRLRARLSPEELAEYVPGASRVDVELWEAQRVPVPAAALPFLVQALGLTADQEVRLRPWR